MGAWEGHPLLQPFYSTLTPHVSCFAEEASVTIESATVQCSGGDALKRSLQCEAHVHVSHVALGDENVQLFTLSCLVFKDSTQDEVVGIGERKFLAGHFREYGWYAASIWSTNGNRSAEWEGNLYATTNGNEKLALHGSQGTALLPLGRSRFSLGESHFTVEGWMSFQYLNFTLNYTTLTVRHCFLLTSSYCRLGLLFISQSSEDSSLLCIIDLPSYSDVCGTVGCDVGMGGHGPLIITTEYKFALPASDIVLSFQSTQPPDRPEMGIMYSQECQGFVRGPACLEPSTATSCAYGAADKCQPCPTGAVCPGGYRLWPLPGYWIADASTATVFPCAEPAAVRCPGYHSGSVCGRLYDQQSFQCSNCVDEYYEDSGLCTKCPPDTEVKVHTTPVVIITGTFAALMALGSVLLTLWFRKNRFKVAPSFGFLLMGELLIWMLNVFQLLGEIGRDKVSRMPEELRRMFQALMLAQVDFAGVVPLECTNLHPLLLPLLIVGIHLVSVIGLIFVGLPHVCGSKRGTQLSSCHGRLHMVLLVLGLFVLPLSLHHALRQLSCHSFGEASVSFWEGNPDIICFQGLHRVGITLAILDMVALLLLAWYLVHGSCLQIKLVAYNRKSIVAGASLKKLWQHLPEELHQPLRNNIAWKPLFSYGQPWLRLFTIAVMALIIVLSFLLQSPPYRILQRGLVIGITGLTGVFFLITNPDHRWSNWKALPRSCLYLTSCLIASLQLSLHLDHDNGIPETESSLTSTLLLYTTVVFLAALPFIMVGSFGGWILSLFGRDCYCCKRRKQQVTHTFRPGAHRVSSSKSAAAPQTSVAPEGEAKLPHAPAMAYLLEVEEKGFLSTLPDTSPEELVRMLDPKQPPIDEGPRKTTPMARVQNPLPDPLSLSTTSTSAATRRKSAVMLPRDSKEESHAVPEETFHPSRPEFAFSWGTARLNPLRSQQLPHPALVVQWEEIRSGAGLNEVNLGNTGPRQPMVPSRSRRGDLTVEEASFRSVPSNWFHNPLAARLHTASASKGRSSFIAHNKRRRSTKASVNPLFAYRDRLEMSQPTAKASSVENGPLVVSRTEGVEGNGTVTSVNPCHEKPRRAIARKRNRRRGRRRSSHRHTPQGEGTLDEVALQRLRHNERSAAVQQAAKDYHKVIRKQKSQFLARYLQSILQPHL